MATNKNSSKGNSTLNQSAQQNRVTTTTVNIIDDSTTVNEEIIMSVEDSQDYRYTFTDSGESRKLTSHENLIVSQENSVQGEAINADKDAAISEVAKSKATAGIATADANTNFASAKKTTKYANSKAAFDSDTWRDSLQYEWGTWKNGLKLGAFVSGMYSEVATGISFAVADLATRKFFASRNYKTPYQVTFFYTSESNVTDDRKSKRIIKDVYTIDGLHVDKFQQVQTDPSRYSALSSYSDYEIQNAQQVGSIMTEKSNSDIKKLIDEAKNDIESSMDTNITIRRFLQPDEIDKPTSPGSLIDFHSGESAWEKWGKGDSLLTIYQTLVDMGCYNLKVFIDYKPDVSFDRRYFLEKAPEIRFYAQNCRLVNYKLGGITNSANLVIEEMEIHIGNIVYEIVGREKIRGAFRAYGDSAMMLGRGL